MTYQLIIQPTALRALADIADRRIRQKIRDRIDGLKDDPDKQGKPLTGELAGYRSLRAVGQRYRIIYQVERQRILVLILMVGLRKQGDRADVYRLAQKLIRLKLV